MILVNIILVKKNSNGRFIV